MNDVGWPKQLASAKPGIFEKAFKMGCQEVKWDLMMKDFRARKSRDTALRIYYM